MDPETKLAIAELRGELVDVMSCVVDAYVALSAIGAALPPETTSDVYSSLNNLAGSINKTLNRMGGKNER